MSRIFSDDVIRTIMRASRPIDPLPTAEPPNTTHPIPIIINIYNNPPPKEA